MVKDSNVGIVVAVCQTLMPEHARSSKQRLGGAMDERRRELRGRTLRSGKIVFNSKQSVIDCIVRDLSDGGACLQVNATTAVPPSFELIVDGGNEASRSSRVAWRSDTRIGVEFLDAGKRGSADAAGAARPE